MDTSSVIWGIAAGCALLAGGGGYFLINRRRSTPHDTGAPSPGATPQEPVGAQPPTAPTDSPPPANRYCAPKDQLENCSRMAGIFAHDFNNIMTAIGGYASLLKKHLADDAKAMRYIGGIIDAGAHASELLDRLSLIAKNETSFVTAIDAEKTVKEVLSALAETTSPETLLPPELAATQTAITGDPALFRRTLTDLGTNAIDSCRENGGTVRFSTVNLTLKEPTKIDDALTLAPGSYLRISVTDTGHGVKESIRPHVFEPFFTTKPKGKSSGLGLAIVWRYAMISGGAVAFESVPDQGTTFELYLPVLIRPLTPPRREPAARVTGTGTSGTTSILVVDDERSVREIFTEILESNGYTVASCGNGREACAFVEHSDRPVHLVLLDLMMPVMNGTETFIKLRSSYPSIKILLMSGYKTSDTIGNLLNQPSTDFFQKPGTADLLIDKIEALLAG
jgi:two-component system, cell cycle sensor histidine kinase and response regulator CckA